MDLEYGFPYLLINPDQPATLNNAKVGYRISLFVGEEGEYIIGANFSNTLSLPCPDGSTPLNRENAYA